MKFQLKSFLSSLILYYIDLPITLFINHHDQILSSTT